MGRIQEILGRIATLMAGVGRLHGVLEEVEFTQVTEPHKKTAGIRICIPSSTLKSRILPECEDT
jgi:hypothetical protein